MTNHLVMGNTVYTVDGRHSAPSDIELEKIRCSSGFLISHLVQDNYPQYIRDLVHHVFFAAMDKDAINNNTSSGGSTNLIVLAALSTTGFLQDKQDNRPHMDSLWFIYCGCSQGG